MAGPEETPIPNGFGIFESNSYLDRLGLALGATDQQIKSAYRELAKRFHPDLNPGDPVAEAKFKLIGEAYENLKIGITAKSAARHEGHSRRRDHRPRTSEGPQAKRRFQELKIEAADVEDFQQGAELALKIDAEMGGTDGRDELLGYLTRRLLAVLQRRLRQYVGLDSLATLSKEVGRFADSPGGKLLFTSFLTDELDIAALNIGLGLLSKANTKQEVDRAADLIAAYPFSFGAIGEIPVLEGKADAMSKIRFLRKIKSIRPQTIERLDALAAEVRDFDFVDQNRAGAYKKQIIDFIDRHKKVYYPGGVFTPMRGISTE